MSIKSCKHFVPATRLVDPVVHPGGGRRQTFGRRTQPDEYRSIDFSSRLIDEVTTVDGFSVAVDRRGHRR
jgi:hypothetical protein